MKKHILGWLRTSRKRVGDHPWRSMEIFFLKKIKTVSTTESVDDRPWPRSLAVDDRTDSRTHAGEVKIRIVVVLSGEQASGVEDGDPGR